MKDKINSFPVILKVIELDSCDSTNNYLKEHHRALEYQLPVLVCAQRQTAGRGRDNRTWESKKGLGLYSSLGFHIDIGKKIGLISLSAGISVIETLLEFAEVDIGLKWPNDIIINGRKKIGGILIENKIFDRQVFCVTGIGVNINQGQEDFQGPLADRAVSLKCLTGDNYAISEVNKMLAHIFLSYLDKINRNQASEIIEKANHWSRYLVGRSISFHHGKDMIQGVFRRIHDDGGVVLENPQGEEKVYYSGEIL